MTVPALEAEDWLAGKNGTVQKVSLDPSKRKADAASTRQQVEVSEQQDTGRHQKEEPSEQVVTTQKQEEEKQLQQTSSTIEPAKEPILKDDTLKPQPKAHPSSYKYIAGKLYHPSTHYDDLRGLSIDKTGTFDLIQVRKRRAFDRNSGLTTYCARPTPGLLASQLLGRAVGWASLTRRNGADCRRASRA